MEDTDLILMVGEIRSDVKKLLKEESEHDRRIRSLERWRWVTGGIGMGVMVVAAKLGFPLHIA